MNTPAQFKALIVALLLSASFLLYVLTVPNMFNMLAFAIYEYIAPRGTSEQVFITLFDLVAAALLLLSIYSCTTSLRKDSFTGNTIPLTK